jgi:small conductance mechanosensitive channel
MPTQLAALEQAKSTLIDLGFRFGPKLVVAILILVAGSYAARWVGAIFDRWLGKLHLEPPVRLLLVRVARLIVIALFLVMALQNLGVDLLPLIAGLSVAGAGVALAMQGVLGNLAAGLTIIFTRPFRVGEFVSMVGVQGRVESIELFATRLSHPDRSIVVVPNRKIVGEILHNYGEVLQLDLGVEIARSADVERALAVIGEVVQANPRVLRDPAAAVGVSVLGERTVRIAVRPWVKVPDAVDAAAEINKGILDAFRAATIEYPSAAREIRVVAA